MGKLLGLPMGMAPCYTLHSQITLDGQQMATQLLASAGANYYMDVYLNNDRMLAYFDTSAHDNQSLRDTASRCAEGNSHAWFVRGLQARALGACRRAPPSARPKAVSNSVIDFPAISARFSSDSGRKPCCHWGQNIFPGR